jgi:hypothetical protein
VKLSGRNILPKKDFFLNLWFIFCNAYFCLHIRSMKQHLSNPVFSVLHSSTEDRIKCRRIRRRNPLMAVWWRWHFVTRFRGKWRVLQFIRSVTHGYHQFESPNRKGELFFTPLTCSLQYYTGIILGYLKELNQHAKFLHRIMLGFKDNTHVFTLLVMPFTLELLQTCFVHNS